MSMKHLAEKLGLDEHEYRELWSVFMETAEKDTLDLMGAIVRRDSDQIKKSAHSLKGSCANFGFSDLQQMAWNIEAGAEARDGSTLMEDAGLLAARLRELKESGNI